MTDQNQKVRLDPIWWTLLRATIILVAGIFIAGILFPAFQSEDKGSTRSTSNTAAFASILKLELDLGNHLLAQKSALTTKIEEHSCSGVQYDQTSLTPNKLGTGALRSIIDHSVVFISSDKGSGTGFFVAPGKVITNSHVVDGATTATIYSKALYQTPVQGTVVATTGHNSNELGARDYALIDVAVNSQAVPLQMSQTINELDIVISAGFPGLFQGFHSERLPRMILRRGEFISELPQSNGNNILAHSAEVFPGNSGGPLLNECGQIVGINTFIIWSTTSVDSTGPQVKTDFALPADDLALFLKSEQITLAPASKPCN